MLLSQYFLPTLKEYPSEAQATSHALMLRSGMIRRNASGIYSWLPMGLKVLQNITSIIRFNMEAVGALEVLMPCIQPADLWLESGRFEDYGQEMLKFKDRNDSCLIFGPTNEEMITDIFRNNVRSYRELPKNLYQIQWKFRDEIRPRFGVMRGREFLMKDAYSFDLSSDEAMRSYDMMYTAYMHSFRDIGIRVIPVEADNGAIGGSVSHEFHVLANTGESTLYYDKVFDLLAEDLVSNIKALKSIYAVAAEKYDKNNCPIPESELCVSRGIEVGHIFCFGTKYSKAMNAVINDKNGTPIYVEMGSYGIGISRLVAAIVEAMNDAQGIVWPEAVAPFKVSVINLHVKDTKSNEVASYVYNNLKSSGIDVLYDETEERPGSKLATHDLIGSPWQVIIGTKNAEKGLVELKHRATDEREIVQYETVLNRLIGSLSCK
jgi:prolyl-tRNA synthetase